MDFCHLQVRSAYSFHYGPRSVADLAAAAKRHGYAALALTDLDNLYGAPVFADACREHGVQPIFGVELGADGEPGRPARERAVLLAASRRGFGRLCELVGRRRGGGEFDLAAELAADSAGLVALSDSPRLLEHWRGRVAELYGLLTPASSQALLPCRRLGIELAASCEATLLEPDDRELQRLLLAIGGRRPFAAVAEAELAPPACRLVSAADAAALFPGREDAVAASARIAGRCLGVELFDGFVHPVHPEIAVPDQAAELRRRVLDGARGRYGEIGDAVLERVDYELAVIGEKGFTGYFLIVADIVALASRTCGRGSGAASIVAYCLGITNVDPIAHNLYFERFLNRDRADPPDIDIDFAWDERDTVMAAVVGRYGAERCARVANHLHYHPRSAIRESARAFGMPAGETGALAGGASGGASVAGWERVLELAERLVGLPHGLSVHCGGMVITPGPVKRHAPVEPGDSASLLGWEKEGTEAAGLIKIDLLGNRSLAVIRDALADLAVRGAAPDALEWRPQSDQATRALLAEGRSIGVFYIESPAMRQLQLKTGQGDFDHIVIHSSIIRPAANRFINEYVRRLRGGAWQPLHPLLDKLLAETYGIMCYQEDISKAAIALAGFGEGDADRLRKIVSKKSPRTLKEFEERFRSGARGRGVAEATIGAVWDMIMSFDGYSFCKPHSASYAMVSFQSAWLKAHHAPEFMAAVLSNQGGFYTPSAYVSEARRLGIAVRGPDANASLWRYTAEDGALRVGLIAVLGLSRAAADALAAERRRAGPFRSLADLCARVGLGRDDCQALAEAGALDSLAPGLPRAVVLRQAWLAVGRRAEADRGGWFATEEPPSAAAASAGAPRGRGGAAGTLAEPAGLSGGTDPEGGRRQSRGELLREFARLGYLVGHHPLALWRQGRRFPDCVGAGRLADFVDSRVRVVAWLVTRKPVWTKTGEAMEFVSFEDEDAIFETVLFPQAYERHGRELEKPQAFLLGGTVRNDLGAIYLDVREIRALGECRASTEP